jgi:hypothetical protein
MGAKWELLKDALVEALQQDGLEVIGLKYDKEEKELREKRKYFKEFFDSNDLWGKKTEFVWLTDEEFYERATTVPEARTGLVRLANPFPSAVGDADKVTSFERRLRKDGAAVITKIGARAIRTIWAERRPDFLTSAAVAAVRLGALYAHWVGFPLIVEISPGERRAKPWSLRLNSGSYLLVPRKYQWPQPFAAHD